MTVVFPAISCTVDISQAKKSWTFNVVIERDEAGFCIASVPNLPSCYTQAKSLDVAMLRIKEVIALCPMEHPRENMANEFTAMQTVAVAV